MGNKAVLLVLMLLVGYGVSISMGHREKEEEEEWSPRERRHHEEGGEFKFLLQDSKRVIRTDAGEMTVFKSFGGGVVDRPMHIGFITMEPQSLFIPQYSDSSLIIFVRRGEARIGHIYNDDKVEKNLKDGDLYRIPAGSAFYMVNTGEGQRLQIVCSIDPSESLGLGLFQSFYIGGGSYPTSILAGFDTETLKNAFNVTRDELRDLFTRQKGGPFVFFNDSGSSKKWSTFVRLNEQNRLEHLKNMVVETQEDTKEEEKQTWLWRKVLNSLFGGESNEDGNKIWSGKAPDSYNLYSRRHDFENNYGYSIAVDESAYKPLKHSGIGVYMVNLTAGSMMAPHVNPTATEYGVVLRGSGRIQIVYPNGTLAMNSKVKVGDVFLVPRYFAFCQIASTAGPFEFFGFTTSARKNNPQFLAGANSLLRSLKGPELAAAFGIDEDKMGDLLDKQPESVIFPSASAADEVEERELVPEMLKSFEKHILSSFV